ncbi:prepilin-type N-terminal cleavage/methylation domain-containing protein [Paucibacter sp. APW11]|uniref:Prepilin-type N-terminal cleavage/methylation domain-containing protein n=1 Tax=Roseateles aquae TaxID=3077235 RepID=A0ABU3P859_9BURK|nr:prepilin-type N-terminal cleavage/methylation domain-containing protein [Paucibacter sp. APW11]MDT8998749.1 prepilin-type N-terminal cleavage/methylation domain-containing protein [Paucibacter sp. APW11]
MSRHFARPYTAAMRPSGRRQPARGLSLIELLIFIVIVSIALAAVLRVFVQAGTASADPQIQRQALAIAESLLEEVELMPFTFCDPDDANVGSATSSAGCASLSEAGIGPEAGENRYATPQFDNVNDYHGFAMTGIRDLSNTAIAGLSGYSASVSVSASALGSISQGSGDALLITVTVTGPQSTSVSLQGLRARHSPNAAL